MKRAPFIVLILVLTGMTLAADSPFDRVLDGIKGDYAEAVNDAHDLHAKRYKAQVEPILKRIDLGRDKAIADATTAAKARLKRAAANSRRAGDEVNAAIFDQEADRLQMPQPETQPAEEENPFIGTWTVQFLKGYKTTLAIKPGGTAKEPGFSGKWELVGGNLKIVWSDGRQEFLFHPGNALGGKSSKGTPLVATKSK